MLADEPETELEIDRLPSVATDSTSNRYTVPAMALNPFRRKSAKLFVPARVFQRFEFVVDIKVAPSLFHMTHIVTISERFLLFNNTRSSIQVGQIGTPGTLLRPSVHIPFHWKVIRAVSFHTALVVGLLTAAPRLSQHLSRQDADGVQELRIKPCQPPGELASVTWGWSGSFRIDEVGEIGVLVRGLYNPKMVKIININISLEVR